MAGGRASCQIQRAEIGATAQDGFIGKLLYHQVGSVIDDLIDDRGRGAIDHYLMRQLIARDFRIVANAYARVRRRNALACRQLGRDRFVRRIARWLDNRRSGRRPYRPDAEIRTHGSLQASLESNPNPSWSATMTCSYQRSVRERNECRAENGAQV